jgi:phage shock protein C
MAKKLYRSRSNKMIAGICGGLAEFMDADPTVVRLVAALLILAGGLSVWAYIIAWVIVPEQPAA